MNAQIVKIMKDNGYDFCEKHDIFFRHKSPTEAMSPRGFLACPRCAINALLALSTRNQTQDRARIPRLNGTGKSFISFASKK